MTQSNILFLCTGNYYRSRFAEEYFNQRARVLDLPWWADSRGLARSVGVDAYPHNLGPISIHALNYLQLYRIEPRHLHRYPRAVEAEDFTAFERVVAVCRREHEPMLRERFPERLSDVEFLDVEDQEVVQPGLAMPKLVHDLDRMLENLLP